MHGQVLSLAASAEGPELKLALPVIPTFSALAHEFWNNLPEKLAGAMGGNGEVRPESHETTRWS